MSVVHSHHHCECQHEHIKYCRHCERPYCLDCGKEWYAYQYYNTVGSYPYYGTYTITATSATQSQHDSCETNDTANLHIH